MDEIECPKCGRLALRNQDNRSGDVDVHCKCGWAGEIIEEDEKRPAEYTKDVYGFVAQKFELVNGEYVCISQEFVAGDEVDRETEDGEAFDMDAIEEEEVYQVMNMVQPESTTKKMRKKKQG